MTEKAPRILTIFNFTIEFFQDFAVSHVSEFNRHFNLICIEDTACLFIFGTLHCWIGSWSENLQRYFLFGRFLKKSFEFVTLIIITSDWILSFTFLIFTSNTAVSLVTTTFRHPKAWRKTVGFVLTHWIFHENVPLLQFNLLSPRFFHSIIFVFNMRFFFWELLFNHQKLPLLFNLLSRLVWNLLFYVLLWYNFRN